MGLIRYYSGRLAQWLYRCLLIKVRILAPRLNFPLVENYSIFFETEYFWISVSLVHVFPCDVSRGGTSTLLTTVRVGLPIMSMVQSEYLQYRGLCQSI